MEGSEPPASRVSAGRRLLSGVVDVLVPYEDPSRAIYGLILIGALLAAESGTHESYLDTIASAAIAAAVYWLAHGYATALGQRLAHRRRLTPGAVMRAMRHDFALIRGAAIPLLALALAAALGASQQTAVTVALWSAIASLGLFELLAGLRAGASRTELALETAIGIAMGLGILLLKIVLH